MTQIQLSDQPVPIDKIGCFFSPLDLGLDQGRGQSEGEGGQGGTAVGPLVGRGCLRSTEPPYWLGPFSTLTERYLVQIECALQYILLGAVCPWALVDGYLWHLELRELVTGCSVLAEKSDELYVRHDDARGDHLLGDEEYQVTGIIDWQWAYVTTKAQAFAPPQVFYESSAYMFDGDNSLTRDEKVLMEIHMREGREDLAGCVKHGRLYQRLGRIEQYDKAYAKSGFTEVFTPFRPSGFDLDPPAEDCQWRVCMMKRYKDDEGLHEIMKKHNWTIERAEEIARSEDKSVRKVEA
ncbi:hypothetical protein I317_02956 [Kwoniella heveanensis CBS 569]|uniref:Aminoglycoside phosphotransferase domain-containing protein n=1 Tax=Kwoniella heveanensis BCC8398 TaxID=1296120 RepID=A0A1B9GLY1_9TREE|nr:hypothetical protein I316_06463 [Kwoniella heveanensis BCC8398]OCF43246.1 hypothetical protein I317_02956 [Kwoniella heveanensis CBS 569]